MKPIQSYRPNSKSTNTGTGSHYSQRFSQVEVCNLQQNNTVSKRLRNYLPNFTSFLGSNAKTFYSLPESNFDIRHTPDIQHRGHISHITNCITSNEPHILQRFNTSFNILFLLRFFCSWVLISQMISKYVSGSATQDQKLKRFTSFILTDPNAQLPCKKPIHFPANGCWIFIAC